jgi:AcrR family transcriptional regulator
LSWFESAVSNVPHLSKNRHGGGGKLNEAVSLSDVRRMRLLDSAAALLNAKGVSQTSLIELADAHGLSRTALYYYFEDREDLVLQCYLRAGQLMLGRLDDAMQAGGGAEQIVARSFPCCPRMARNCRADETGFLRDKRRQIISALHEKTTIG